MVDIVEVRQEELKRKKICRFCLSRVEADLTNIYTRDQRMKTAPLPLQVMACVSIEVFHSDCMPVFVCQECRLMFDYCYRFKQMCKKADQSLRNYTMTGQIIPEIEKPKIPPQILKKDLASIRNPLQQQSRVIKSVPQVQDIDEESSDTILTMIDDDQTDTPKQRPAMPPQQIQKRVPAPPTTDKTSHKLLNKAAIRILNKEAHQTPSEPIMSKPVLKQDEDGNLTVVTEILDRDDYSRNESEAIEKASVIETNVFPCPNCERSFPLRQLLDIHMVNHNRERSFACSDCEKSFYSKYDLQKHVLVHTGERPYKCVVCNRGFTRSTLLHRHEKTHTDIPKFICVFCEKPFISQEEMEKHTERHRRKRPFTCKMCDKSFAFKQGLERHEVVHFKKQPFQCQYCVESFSTPSKLARHLTAHAGDRPYPCKLCPKSYLLSHHLTRHMRSHKNGSGLYKCNDCDKNFSARDDLIYHSAVHATQTLVCPLCKDVFEDIETVTEHVKAHAEGEAYACEFCDLIFMTAERLQDHTDAEHAEDMVAYNQDDEANAAARQNKLNANTSRDVDEVIEEFLIEEFSDAGDTVASNIIVKEETDWQNARPSEQNNASDESQETYLKEEGETVEEPPAKVSKATVNVQKVTKAVPAANPPRKTAVKPILRSPPVVLNSNSSSPKENKKPEKQLSVSSTVVKSEAVIPAIKVTKTRQPTIQQALQALPRGLSVKKVAPTTNTQQSTPTQKKVTQSPTPTPKSSTTVSSVREELGVLTSPESGSDTKESPKPNSRMLRQRSETSPNIKAKSTTTTSSPNVEDVKKPLQKTTPVSEKKSNAMPGVDNKIVEMMIGDKKVKVQRITMTKAQAAAMAREGRIQMKEGTMILKKDPNKPLKSAKKSS